METRTNRRQSSIVTKVIIAGMIFTFISLFGIPFLNFNDATVYHDKDAEKTMEHVWQPNTTINWSEARFQDAMHKMTHQKVVAKSKIGAIKLNDKNVVALVGIAEYSNYEHKDYYLEVLFKWMRSDFSDIDKVHNEIRKLQGKPSQDSRAYGVAPATEEKRFIEKVFKD